MTALLILSYNNTPATIACLESILQYNTSPVKFLVVDNGSTVPDAVSRLEAWIQPRFEGAYRRLTDADEPDGNLPKMTLLASAANDGYARGNNKGLRHIFADSEVENIAILNNYILFVEDAIPHICESYGKIGNCGIVTPLLLRSDGKVDMATVRYAPSAWTIMTRFGYKFPLLMRLVDRDWFNMQVMKSEPATDEPFETQLPNGSFMYASAEVWKAVEGFDPRTFLYYEENILYKKTSQLGLRNYCVPSGRAIHLGAATTGRRFSPFLQKCEMHSADIYLRYYESLNLPKRIYWQVIKWVFPVKVAAVAAAKSVLNIFRKAE